MRPGLLCPGKGTSMTRFLARMHDFNEAGAVMPRKSRSASASTA